MKEYLAEQIVALKNDDDFQKHKWFLSEQAQRDVGFRSALQTFCSLPEYQAFAKHFRKSYCSSQCPFGSECTLWHEKKNGSGKDKQTPKVSACGS